MRCISSIFAFFAGFNYAGVAESPARASPAAQSTDCLHGHETASDGVMDRLGMEDPYFAFECSILSVILWHTLQGKIRRESKKKKGVLHYCVTTHSCSLHTSWRCWLYDTPRTLS